MFRSGGHRPVTATLSGKPCPLIVKAAVSRCRGLQKRLAPAYVSPKLFFNFLMMALCESFRA
jgi:hypothetical protein